MADPRSYQDRIQTLCIIVSAVTGKVYRFLGLQSFTTAKSDSGDAGTFSLSFQPRPATVAKTALDDAADYVKVASPMDLVAIYARRLSTVNGVRETATTPLGPYDGELAAIKYGGDLGASVRVLTAATKAPTQRLDAGGNALDYLKSGEIPFTPISNVSCIFLGMVDSVQEVVNGGVTVGFTATGKDLTKIGYINDTQVPQMSSGSLVAPTLITLALSKENSGASLLLDVLDATIKKKLPKSVIGSLPAATAAAIASFGYPWDDFILTDRLDPAFRSFRSASGKYLPFSLQSGSAWANVQTIRNQPINRLFIDELGQIVFDDQYAAWTEAPYARVPGEEVGTFAAGFDDANLVTLLSIFANGSLAARSTIAQVTGLLRKNLFVGGLAEVSRASDTRLSTFGYRYAEGISNYDVTAEDALARRKVLIFSHNNLWRGNAVLRGNGYYRVGDRYLIDVPTNRLEASRQVWYVSGVEHQFNFGDDWTTHLTLAYPPVTGAFP